MSKTIIVAGFGPGISTAVAETFGKQGFTVALVARNAERLGTGVKALQAKGVRAEAFTADLAQPDAVRAVVRAAREKLGPIGIVQWTAYSGATAGDITTADASAVRNVYDVAVTGLVSAVQEALPDLRANKGAVLITNGGFGLFDSGVDAAAVHWNAMGLSIANSAKHKLARLLALKLAPDGVFVGEVIVTATVKGTAFDSAGHGTIEPSAVAAKFWSLYSERAATTAMI